jgi:hypothetical protein
VLLRGGDVEMRYRPKENVVARREEDKMIVFNPKTGQVIVLSPSSAFIWEQCTGENGVDQIVELITSSYEVPAEPEEGTSVTEMFQTHLRVLEKAGFLETVAE